jgi:acyl carrier protein
MRKRQAKSQAELPVCVGYYWAPRRAQQHQQEVVVMTETAHILALDTIRAQVHQYVMQNFLFSFEGARPEIDDDAPLLESGVVDATGLLELMLFVEESYGLQVAEADLTPENFDTVNNIADYVGHHLANS